MAFQPQVGDTLEIDGARYSVSPHPAAPSVPYGQEGRAGTVYQLDITNGDPGAGGAGATTPWGGDPRHRGLKVFKPRYRIPSLVSLTERLEAFADLPGLEVCRRSVLTPQRHSALLHAHPDLTYAVLMPWISGPTWMEVMLDERDLSVDDSLLFARSLVELLATMEQRGLAHCDLSGPNVLLPALAVDADPSSLPPVALVDVEQLFGPGLSRPEVLTGGSPGYAQHRGAPEGLWESRADRFAGAILIAEMLAWCDSRVREAGWGETYFEAQETQEATERYELLVSVLTERWGQAPTGLFERAWQSEVLADCPTFGEWLVMMPEAGRAPAPPVPTAVKPTTISAPQTPDEVVSGLMSVARDLEDQGNRVAALEVYEQARRQASDGSGLRRELELIVQQLQAESTRAASDVRSATRQPPPPPAAVEAQPDPSGFLADGTAAFQRGEWGRARELLNEAVRWLPEPSTERREALRMIATAEKRLAPPRAPRPWRLWAGFAAVVGVIVAGALLYRERAAQEEAQMRASAATATAEAAAQASATADAAATAAAVASATAQAEQQAQATSQALELVQRQATATAQARAAQATPTRLPPTATPTVDALWLTTLRFLEPVWEKDWPAAIRILEGFLRDYPRYRPAEEKLYGALVAYADQLIANDQDEEAVKRLLQAQALLPDRDEAEAALLALTPTPTPAAPPKPVVPPGPVAPPGPAVVPTKSPLAPR